MFGLDPESIVARVQTANQPVRVPGIGESVLRGMAGFTVVSLAGFAPWVLAGRWFYRNTGEAGLYAMCALMFIGLSSPLLHRLIIGPGSMVRFYKLFSLAFLAYAVVWTVAWMTLVRAMGAVTAGSVGGLAGIAVMGGMLAWGFEVPTAAGRMIGALVVTNLASYFIGEWAYNGVLALKEDNALGWVLERQTRSLLSKAAWGLFYGLGFGAGIGYAIYAGQSKARELLKTSTVTGH